MLICTQFYMLSMLILLPQICGVFLELCQCIKGYALRENRQLTISPWLGWSSWPTRFSTLGIGLDWASTGHVNALTSPASSSLQSSAASGFYTLSNFSPNNPKPLEDRLWNTSFLGGLNALQSQSMHTDSCGSLCWLSSSTNRSLSDKQLLSGLCYETKLCPELTLKNLKY